MDKLNIANEMRQFDLKNRNFYNDLTDEERKKFSNYLMIRWGSTIQGSREMQEFYVIAVNERLNRHFFSINRHPDLQWLLATAVSPGMGVQRHQWISPKKKQSSDTGVRRRLKEYFPNMKLEDINVMATMNTAADLERYDKVHGITPK